MFLDRSGLMNLLSRWTCGSLLIFAGILKSVELLQSGNPTLLTVLVGGPGTVAVTAVELGLGIALVLSRRFEYLLFALLFFGVAAIVNVALISIGQVTCGCFGQLTVKPHWALAINVVCAIVLFQALRGERLSLGALRNGLVAISLFVIAMFSVVWGAMTPLASTLRQEWIVAPIVALNAGRAPVGEDRILTFEVTNVGSAPVVIVGSNNSCKSRLIEQIGAITLQPRQTRSIQVQARFGPQPGLMLRTFDLITDCPSQPVVRLRYFGFAKPTKPLIAAVVTQD